jgi:hypothetical protein
VPRSHWLLWWSNSVFLVLASWESGFLTIYPLTPFSIMIDHDNLLLSYNSFYFPLLFSRRLIYQCIFLSNLKNFEQLKMLFIAMCCSFHFIRWLFYVSTEYIVDVTDMSRLNPEFQLVPKFIRFDKQSSDWYTLISGNFS